jgi:hypothetical protein
LKPFRILAYVALIEVRNNVWGYKPRVSTEPLILENDRFIKKL